VPSHLDDGDRIQSGVELRVRQVLESSRYSQMIVESQSEKPSSTIAGTSARGFTCRKSVRLQSPWRARTRSNGTPFS
jgi:hypothetical protein